MNTRGKTPHPPDSVAPSRRNRVRYQHRLHSATATRNDADSNSRPIAPAAPPVASGPALASTLARAARWSLLEHLRVRSGGHRVRWQNRKAAELLRKLREDPHAFVHARTHDGGRGLRASASASASARASNANSKTAVISSSCDSGTQNVPISPKPAGTPDVADEGMAVLDADDPYDLELLIADGGGVRCSCGQGCGREIERITISLAGGVTRVRTRCSFLAPAGVAWARATGPAAARGMRGMGVNKRTAVGPSKDKCKGRGVASAVRTSGRGSEPSQPAFDGGRSHGSTTKAAGRAVELVVWEECISIAQFEREAVTFRMLRRLRGPKPHRSKVFARARERRAFGRWQKEVSRRRFARRAMALAALLGRIQHNQRALASALRHAHECANGLTLSLSLSDIDFITSETGVAQLRRVLSRFTRRIERLVYTACEHSLRTTLVKEGFGVETHHKRVKPRVRLDRERQVVRNKHRRAVLDAETNVSFTDKVQHTPPAVTPKSAPASMPVPVPRRPAIPSMASNNKHSNTRCMPVARGRAEHALHTSGSGSVSKEARKPAGGDDKSRNNTSDAISATLKSLDEALAAVQPCVAQADEEAGVTFAERCVLRTHCRDVLAPFVRLVGLRIRGALVQAAHDALRGLLIAVETAYEAANGDEGEDVDEISGIDNNTERGIAVGTLDSEVSQLMLVEAVNPIVLCENDEDTTGRVISDCDLSIELKPTLVGAQAKIDLALACLLRLLSELPQLLYTDRFLSLAKAVSACRSDNASIGDHMRQNFANAVAKLTTATRIDQMGASSATNAAGIEPDAWASPTVALLATADTKFTADLNRIQMLVGVAYARALRYSRCLTPLLRAHVAVRAFLRTQSSTSAASAAAKYDRESMALKRTFGVAIIPDLRVATVAEVESLMLHLAEHKRQVTCKLRLHRDGRCSWRIGMLNIDMSHLADKIRPLSRRALDDLHQRLPLVVGSHADALYREIVTATSRLACTDTVTSAAGFAELSTALDELQSREADFEAQCMKVEGFHKLIRDVAVDACGLDERWTVATRGLLTKVQLSQRDFVDTLARAKRDFPLHRRRFGAELAAEAPKLRERVMAVQKDLADPKLMTIDTEPKAALKQLAGIERCIEREARKTQAHRRCRRTLKLDTDSDLLQLLQSTNEPHGILAVMDEEDCEDERDRSVAVGAPGTPPKSSPQPKLQALSHNHGKPSLLTFASPSPSPDLGSPLRTPSSSSAAQCIGDLEQARRELLLQRRFWASLAEFRLKREEWLSTDIWARTFDADAAVRCAHNFEQGFALAARAIGERHMAAADARREALELQRQLPLVGALHRTELKHRHWNAINIALGFQLRMPTVQTSKPNLPLALSVAEFIARTPPDVAAAIMAIVTDAVHEAELSQMLDTVRSNWASLNLTVEPYKPREHGERCYVIHEAEEVLAAVDDSLATLHTILGSVSQAEAAADNEDDDRVFREADEWRCRLSDLLNTFSEWLEVQKRWIQLEPIYNASDIQKQLPDASKTFAAVDSQWRGLMERAWLEPNCLARGTEPDLRERLGLMRAELDHVQRKLKWYLDGKRTMFPRFCFLSDEELVSVLSQMQNPRAVQPHLHKCFDAISRLELLGEGSCMRVNAMLSPQGERVDLSVGRGKDSYITTSAVVERWLLKVERAMRLVLHQLLEETLVDLARTQKLEHSSTRRHSTGERGSTPVGAVAALGHWVLRHNAQCVAAATQIVWTRKCEGCISKSGNSWAMLYDDQLSQLRELTRLVRDSLQKLQRRIVVALITTNVHARDVVKELWDDGVCSLCSFLWQRQLRFYWRTGAVTGSDVDGMRRSDAVCSVSHCDAQINYGYEYVGASSRLVVTPLTDRCWMTISGAFHLRLGASPVGPAGTGKTETSKDLAKGLAIFCVVFNCSETTLCGLLERQFSGVAQQGSWICLDEFNRIDIEVLSVAATLLTQLNAARCSAVQCLNLNGRDIALRPYHIIVTMNLGYAGRTELPDNLKILFRPIAMVIPSYSLIAEIMLFAEGFDNAQILSRKLVQVYQLSAEQLSQQPQYDFGLRAIKSVLLMAGQLRRGVKHQEPRQQQISTAVNTQATDTWAQDAVLMRATLDTNEPKLLPSDLPLYRMIVHDLFPECARDGTKSQFAEFAAVHEHDTLMTEFERQANELHLQLDGTFITKAMHLCRTLAVRFGVAQIGPAGGGKSSCRRLLQHALSARANACDHTSPLFDNISVQVIFPKSLSASELFGNVNRFTNEWNDGVASALIRSAADTSGVEEGRERRMFWTVFDGPIDALWIENMNTVLDDTMTLCLSNGERIKLNDRMRMIFETEDLIAASPATVSRLGVVYAAPNTHGWRACAISWLAHCEALRLPDAAMIDADIQGDDLRIAIQEARTRALLCFDKIFGPALRFVRKHCKQPMPTTDIGMVQSCCMLLGSMLTRRSVFGGGDDRLRSQKKQVTASHSGFVVPSKAEIDHFFVFSVVWSLGGSILDTQRAAFDDCLRNLISDADLLIVLPPGGEINASVNEVRTLFDVFVEVGKVEDHDTTDGPLEDRYISFVPWMNAMPSFSFQPDMNFHEFEVPTIDTRSYATIMSLSIDAMHPITLTGVAGAGKSTVARALLRELAPQSDSRLQGTADRGMNQLACQNVLTVPLHFSLHTDSRATQNSIVRPLQVQQSARHLAAPKRHKVVVFVDDFNMPAKDISGAQAPIELLRQLLDSGGLLDRAKADWTRVSDVTVLAAGAPPASGRTRVSDRFMRHCHVLCMPSPSQKTMSLIFSAIVSGFLHDASFNFSDNIKQLTASLVGASIAAYDRSAAKFLPTPTNPHHAFNMRDLAEIFQGFLMLRPENCAIGDDGGVSTAIRLWIHESLRVFQDRLADDAHKRWCESVICELLQSHFLCSWDDLQSNGPTDFADLLFGGFMVRGDQQYREVTSVQRLSDVLAEFLQEYNGLEACEMPMELFFFPDAVRHVSRLCRVLQQPRGHALLIGLSGSGRHSLARLACFITDCTCKTIEMIHGSSSASDSRFGCITHEVRDQLKEILVLAGCSQSEVVLLVGGAQIVDDVLLSDINGLVNTGEVPSLFSADELEDIVQRARPLARTAGQADTRNGVLSFFGHSIREHLHVVLTFSPVGNDLRHCCRKFPSLVNCCTTDWYGTWPTAALHSVASQLLCEQREQLKLPAQVIPSLCHILVGIHQSVATATERLYNVHRRQHYTTPVSFIELLKLYCSMLQTKRGDTEDMELRYRVGLQKLEETDQTVRHLKETLVKLQPTITQSQVDTAELLSRVQKDEALSAAEHAVVQRDVDETDAVAQQVSSIKASCQRDLDAALPAYQQSLRALNTLKAEDIHEVKQYPNPPDGVKMTMDAVCILFGKKEEWKEAKLLMSNMRFLDTLMGYDKDKIDEGKIVKLNQIVGRNDFTPAAIGRVSVACKCICRWVRAMHAYHAVLKRINPKRMRLAVAEADLRRVTGELKKKQDALQVSLEKLNSARRALDVAQGKKLELENQALKTHTQLRRAQQLVGVLGSEKERWKAAVASLSTNAHSVVGNVVLGAACVAYFGPFPHDFREKLLSKWIVLCALHSVPVNENFSLERLFGDPVLIRKWVIDDCLPGDSISIENAMLAKMGRRWPLMIDPQGQANRWIRSCERKRTRNLCVVKLVEHELMRGIADAVRYGGTVLLEDVGETLDSHIDPVLQRNVFMQAGRQLLRLGDKIIPFADGFRMFITTKLPNPHYGPEVCIRVAVINFTVTQSGLEDQLLVAVVKNEHPELQRKADELVLCVATYKTKLTQLEETMLSTLVESNDSVLEDETLIELLEQSKGTAIEVSSAKAAAEATSEEISSARDVYRAVATRASMVYFVIMRLAYIDPMYQYSLQQYQQLFEQRLRATQPTDDNEVRVANLLADVTRAMYVSICRGLFERHKQLFAFMIAAEIERERGLISSKEWHALLLNVPISDCIAEPPITMNVPGEWLRQRPNVNLPSTWERVVALEEHLTDVFSGLSAHIAAHEDAWYSIFETGSKPHCAQLPAPWHAQLTAMQKLLLTRAMRPELTAAAARTFIDRQAVDTFGEAPQFDIEGTLRDSTPDTPIIVVLSPGVDPSDALLRLAQRQGKGDGIRLVSLGQGQDAVAEQAITRARMTGDWICLQNCHLAVSWLPRLEQLLDDESNRDLGARGSHTNGANELLRVQRPTISPHHNDCHPEHRLWLTSRSSLHFPVPVLLRGLKLTHEQPRGLRAHLQRVFAAFSSEEYECFSSSDTVADRWFKRLSFGLAFFNAIVLERRKFGPLGWNIPYNFMGADFRTGIAQLRSLLERVQKEAQDFDDMVIGALEVMIGQVTYGGRITDEWDQRCNSALFRACVHSDVIDNDAFSFDVDNLYRVPPVDACIADVCAHIARLPAEDLPSTFGLHPNADISLKEEQSALFIEMLVVASAGDSEFEVVCNINGNRVGTDDHVGGNDAQQSAVVLSLSSRIPSPLDISSANPETLEKIEGNLAPLASYVLQEVVRYNRMTGAMTTALQNLGRALNGLSLMSPELEGIQRALMFNKVPPAWTDAGLDGKVVGVGFASLLPLASWFDNLLARLCFIEDWLLKGPRSAYWLSGFFYPQGFVTAVKQEFARRHHVSVGSLTLGCEITKELVRDYSAVDDRDHSESAVANSGGDCNARSEDANTDSAAGAWAADKRTRLSIRRENAAPQNEGVGCNGKSGTKIFGLYMQGARFDISCMALAPSRPRVVFEKMPCIWLHPVDEAELPTSGHYLCPVYKTSARCGVLSTTGHSTNFVLALSVPISGSVAKKNGSENSDDQWTRSGVAMVLMPC